MAAGRRRTKAVAPQELLGVRKTSGAAAAALPRPNSEVPRRAPGTPGMRCLAYPDLDLQLLGRVLGLSSTYVGRILNGRSRPSMRVAQEIAELMGWTIDQVNRLYNPKKNPKVSPPDEESIHAKSRNNRKRKRRAAS
jgi:DNA-binding XRE family transcriptional regulator